MSAKGSCFKKVRFVFPAMIRRRPRDEVLNTGLPDGWHSRDTDDVLAALDATAEGLSGAEASRRLHRYGPNRLPEPPTRGALIRFLSQFHNILIYVLLGSAAITAALDRMVDTIVILAVVIVNAVIGFVQEGRAERAIESIRHMLAPRASVLRDGRRRNIDGQDLVPGDLVLLEAGEKVPADVRLLGSRGLQVQEAILTGESLPVEKDVRPVPAGAVLGDRASMAFSGTLVTAGLGRGVVVATGACSEIGRISGMLSGIETLTTPLIRQMNVFARWLTILILLIAALLLAYGHFVAHYEFTQVFMAVVGLSVAAIPEGLPAVLTITLAIGVQAMARRNAIVRRLPVIETLGAISVICTDKTGTLTRNEMMAASVAAHGRMFSLAGNGYEPKGTITLDDLVVEGSGHPVLEELARAAALCNDASLHEHGGLWSVSGDPMEGALLVLSRKIGYDAGAGSCAWMRTDTIPFDPRHRFMATLHHDHEGHVLVLVKGAPERILDMCTEQRTETGGAEPLDAVRWHKVAGSIAGRGERVLAFATGSVPPARTILGFSDVESGLTLIGFVGIMDPPRAEAVEAIAECRQAGIRVKMITGDHAGTAAAVGRQIGLQNTEKVLTGVQLDHINDSELAAAVLDTDIFARTSPEHKLRLVRALQSHGFVVAMTGDGVNDAPALKRADAGIAMGRKGSEAAKDAAGFVLADDNFATIVAAIREGRTVYDNIRKVISWTLPTSTGEAVTIIVALLFGMTLPVTPIQILWINLVTATTLGVALAFEPTEANTMRRPPRARDEPVLTGWLAWHIVLVSILFLCGVFGIFRYSLERGDTVEMARTLAMNTLVVMEIFHMFFIRNIYGTSLNWKAVLGTRVVWTTVIAVTLAQFAITYLSPLQEIFETTAVSFPDGLLVVGAGVALFAVIEIEKQLRLSAFPPQNRTENISRSNGP